MKFSENIKHSLFNLSHLGTLSSSYWKRSMAPLAGVILIALGRAIYPTSPDLFYALMIITLGLFILASEVGFDIIPLEETKQILLPKIVGTMLSFWSISVQLGNVFFVIFIFCMFSSLAHFLLIEEIALKTFRPKMLLKFELSPKNNLEAYSVYLSAGLCTSFFFNFLKIFSLTF